MATNQDAIENEGRLSSLESDVENLERWQSKQNGAIHEVNKKVDKLQYWIMGTAVGVAAQLLYLLVGL